VAISSTSSSSAGARTFGEAVSLGELIASLEQDWPQIGLVRRDFSNCGGIVAHPSICRRFVAATGSTTAASL
jgi:hypothetical protein